MQNTFHPRHKAHGFSLLEVLISIIILSFGLLGMVGLQAAALQANREARLQSTAGSLARELAEMMRGNKDIGLLTTANPYLGNFTSPLTPNTASYCLNVAASTSCADTTAIANAQMTEWLSRVDSQLPGARVQICVDSAPFDAAGMAQWACTSSGTGASTVIKMGWTRGATDRSQTGANALDRASTPALVLPITPGNTI
jgi:type IV pilus assembly protein PilV